MQAKECCKYLYNKFLQSAMNKFKDHTKMADILSEWMKKSFGMTASMPVDASVDVIHCEQNIESSEKKNRTNNLMLHPSNFTLTDIDSHKRNKMDQQRVHTEDTNSLFHSLQIHRCNAYCMRKRNYW